MKIKGNTILITGGATGIGFALADAFVKAGNEVIICGRRAAKLAEAKKKLPQIATKQCDLSKKDEREAFCNWVKENYPDLNIVINNAGVQRFIDLKKGTSQLFAGEDEAQINFKAPIHLSTFFAPLLAKKKEAAIINVSSGLGFVAIAAMPVYCATKAGVHSFTVSLRHQLKDTSVKVFEIVPPAVDTELGGGSASEDYKGIPASEVAEATLKALAKDKYDIIVGEARNLVTGSKKNFAKAFEELNS